MEFRFCPWCAAGLAPRAVPGDGGPVDRLACTRPDCGFVHWGNPTPAVGALVEHEGEIILARNKLWPEGMFALVTGFLEAREDPVQAVIREVREDWMRARGLEFEWDERPPIAPRPVAA